LKTLVSVIIPSHNSEPTIERCIHSLTSQSYPREQFEIIVVDDSSSDNTVNLARAAGADTVISTEPCSIGKARNIGVKQAKGKFLAFIDSDCEAKDGWLKSIAKELHTTQVLTGPIDNGNPESLVAWAEYFIEFGGFHKFRKRSSVRFSPSCNTVVKKETLLRVGGFTEMHSGEDVLFGESLRRAGVEVLFIPEIQILHLCRTNLNMVLSNMKKLGKGFVIARRIVPTLKFSYLIKSRYLIPTIFFGKIAKSTIYAIKVRKAGKFLLAFPYVILASASFCRGILSELQGERHKCSTNSHVFFV